MMITKLMIRKAITLLTMEAVAKIKLDNKTVINMVVLLPFKTVIVTRSRY